MEHARLSSELKGERGIIEMRKHLCWYLQQVPGTRKLRQKAVKISNLQDVAELLSNGLSISDDEFCVRTDQFKPA